MSTKELTFDMINTLDENRIQLVFNFVRFLKSEYSENPNAETIAAIEEVEEMRKNPEKYKSYSSFGEILNEVQEELNSDV